MGAGRHGAKFVPLNKLEEKLLAITARKKGGPPQWFFVAIGFFYAGVILVIAHIVYRLAFPKQRERTTPSALMLPLPTNLREMKFFPSPFEYAILSMHSYEDNVSENQLIEVLYQGKRYRLQGWKVYKCFAYNEQSNWGTVLGFLGGYPGGYRGVLYINRDKKQMVLAHRGTDVLNASAMKTNYLCIWRNKCGGQERFIPNLVRQSSELTQREGCLSLSFTGHSLGGWLAQLSLFHFHYENELLEVGNLQRAYYTKAVTFDTPGAYEVLDKINRSRRRAVSLENNLAITNYLSLPNIVNCCNRQVGTCYRVIFDRQLNGDIKKHRMGNFLEAFDYRTSGEGKDREKQCLLLTTKGKREYKNFTLSPSRAEGVYGQRFQGTRFFPRDLPKWFKKLLKEYKSLQSIDSLYGFRKDRRKLAYSIDGGVDYRLFLDGLMDKGESEIRKFFDEQVKSNNGRASA